MMPVATLIRRRMTAIMSARVRHLPRSTVLEIGVLVDLKRRRRNALVDVGVLDAIMELAAELVAADAGEIVALLVEEQRLEQLLGVLGVLGLARTQLLVDFLERVFARLDVLSLSIELRISGELSKSARIASSLSQFEAEIRARERADERRHVDLAVLVDADADRALGLVVLRPVVGLELDPCAAVRDDRRVERRALVGVDVLARSTRRANARAGSRSRAPRR